MAQPTTTLLLTRKQIAAELSISVWTLDRWVKRGLIPAPGIPGPRTARWTAMQLRRIKKAVASSSIQ